MHNIKYLHCMRRKHVPLHWFTLCHNQLCFQEVIDWNETWCFFHVLSGHQSACHFHLWPSKGKVSSWNLWDKIHRNHGQCRQLWDRSWFKISIAKQLGLFSRDQVTEPSCSARPTGFRASSQAKEQTRKESKTLKSDPGCKQRKENIKMQQALKGWS